MKLPVQKPGKSKQDYATPWPLFYNIERRFGTFEIDLAAHAGNHKCNTWFGPDGVFPDSLNVPWHEYNSLLWLNPPYDHINPWAEKCMVEASRGAKIIMLVPAAIGSEWYAHHVFPYASTIALRPRISFDGKNPYPKDCMLCIYGIDGLPKFDTWRWNLENILVDVWNCSTCGVLLNISDTDENMICRYCGERSII